ncbi:MAG TPA: helix-turn-helix domain-containing protein [candidate division Zixibacteria bacterium]|nr:helix-turn-helix domain-containing protein [candidate division Zixibacteria bacterium]
MMRKLPSELDREILDLLLQGVAYREISRRFGISTSSVARVAEDARKENPDFDSLRGLSVLLKKTGSNVFDAVRASRLLEALNKWGISVDKLGDYVRANERFLFQRALNEDFLFYAVKLMQLEQTSGLTYQEVVEDFEEKVKGAAEAEERKLAFEKESLSFKAESNEAAERLTELKAEIEDATTVQKGLSEIGLHKLAQLVRFVQDFEALGFDANQMKKLIMWYRGLQKLHINPDELEKYIAERGPLEAQNELLRLAKDKTKDDIDLSAIFRKTLVAENAALKAVDLTLRKGTLSMQCKSCRRPVPIWLPTQKSFSDLMKTGQAVAFQCENCGMSQSFTAWDIAFQIAWMILPR